MLSRDAFFAVRPVETAEVSIPSLGGKLRIKALTVRELEQLQADNDKHEGRKFLARLAVACVVDEHGQPFFKSYDVDRLEAQPSKVLRAIQIAANKLNAVGEEEEEALEKKSEETPSSDSE